MTQLDKFITEMNLTIEEFLNFKSSDIGKRAMSLRASISIIRFDVMRHILLFQELNSEKANYSRIRIMCDEIKTIIEAKEWFDKKANKELREIAIEKGFQVEEINSLFRELKVTFNLSKLDVYRDYRNSISAHYDLNLATELNKFGDVAWDDLIENIKGLIEYTGKWLQILKRVFEFT